MQPRPFRSLCSLLALGLLLGVPLRLVAAEPTGLPAPVTPSASPSPSPVIPGTATPAADAYEAPEFIREKPLLPESVDARAAQRLSLSDALRLAVKNNLGIVLSKQQFALSEQAIERSLGPFEPALTAAYLHRNADSPPATVQEGTGQLLHSTNDRWSAGYSQRIRLGTQFGLDLTNERAKSSLGTAVQPLLYHSELSVRLTQPLLKGFAFRWEVPNAEVLRAEFGSERARQDVFGSVLATIRDTEQAYWDLVQSLKTYQVQQGSLKLAEEQLALTGRQIEAGVLPPSDLINAEGTLAQRQLGLVQAESGIEQAADQLRHLLNLPRASWSDPILPVDAPAFDELRISFDAAFAQALEHRPELKQLGIDLKRAALDVRVAGTERLPQLDASLSYGLVGQKSEYGDTMSQLFSGDARAWSALLNFSWTPLNRGATAQLEAVRLNERALRTVQQQALLDLRLELRTAIRGLDTADRSVRAAAKFRSLAERSLDAEQRKFINGTSNNFFIAQRQDDLSRARLAELAALIGHRKAATALRAAMGVLLDDRQVRLDVRAP